ncbi:MAG: helix-turn-helix domain-containing protein [Geobacter sp.]
MNNFSNRLEILIKESKTKKKVLAEAIGLSPAAITEMVKGRSGASGTSIRAIANYYHVREEWLEYGTLPIYPEEPQFKPEVFYEKMAPDELELLKYYRQLCPDQKLMIIPMMRGLLSSPTKSEENESRERVLKAVS